MFEETPAAIMKTDVVRLYGQNDDRQAFCQSHKGYGFPFMDISSATKVTQGSLENIEDFTVI